MADDLYDINKYSDQQLYDILDMNNPTDRELEAKIIHLIQKYENMQNDSGDQLANFFHRIYNHFFNTDDNIESFQNPTPDPKTQQDPSKFALLNDDNSGNAIKNSNMFVNPEKNPAQNPISTLNHQSPTISPDAETIPTEKTIAYTPKQISSVQQFDYSADNLQLNPLIKQTIKRIISIDSQYRDIKTNPMTTNFSFDLSEPLKDVVSLKLYSVQIPFTWYTIPKSYGSNFFYLKGANSEIKDGNHDYKIEISPGNYSPNTLETEINKAFCDISNNTPIMSTVKSAASDVNFSTTNIITYNANTSKMTMNIDLQKVYSEAYYKLYFPNWTSPLTDANGSIPGYMGFNNDSYYPCSISSNQTIYTTDNIITETNQDYILTEYNNYFTVNIYSNSSLVKSYKVVLQNYNTNNNTYIHYTGDASRTQIYNSINTTLQRYTDITTGENVFEPNSGIKYIDIFGNNIANAGKRYYQLTIILNRYIVKYIPNTKVEIVFPIETFSQNNTSSIWVYNTQAFHNAFFFSTSTNTLSEFLSESPAVFSSYVVDTSTNIILTCNKKNYTGGLNDISFNIPTGQYTLNGITSTITTAFASASNNTPSNIIFYTNSSPTESKGAFIEPTTQKFTLVVDMEKKFSTQHYHISWGTTSLLAKMGNYNVGDIWTGNTDLSINPSENIFTHSILNLAGSGYQVDVSYIFTITPNKNITNPGNKYADPIDVYLNPHIKSFVYIEDYISAINNSINNVYIDTQRVFAGSSFTGTYNTNTKNYDLSLNISYNYSLTERNYDISFVDYTYDITNTKNIWKTFDISSNYNLSLDEYYITTNGTYAKIVGGSKITGDQINIVSGSNTIILQPNGLSQYNIPNKTIALEISPNRYTINELFSEINTKINANPILYGSNIVKLEINNKVYTKFIISINNIYTSKDYNLIFYDPLSFVKCYSGSRSVQNTTWDSTLGWILGYRDYTQYSLLSSNQVSNGTGSYYYLTSQTGIYSYASIINSINNLLTNVKITLEGDTTVSTNLYNYFLISLDDYIQNHLNDGLVTITRKETALSLPDYSYATTQICDPITNTLISVSTQQSNSDNITNKQLYSLNQSIYSQKNSLKTYSPGPFIKDLFGFIPIKPPSKNGDYYIEFGGSLQNQERLYFGPVNIRKMTIQLLNDRGDVVDLNNTNWSFSFICEQLYRT